MDFEMKKIIFIFTFLFTTLSVRVCAFSEYSEAIFDEKEYEDILNLCETDPFLSSVDYKGREEFTGEFKRYVMDEGVFEHLISSGISFMDLVEEEQEYCDIAYEWIVLFRKDCYFEVAHNKAGWYINGLTVFDEDDILKPEGTDWAVGLPNSEIIESGKKQYLTAVKHFRRRS